MIRKKLSYVRVLKITLGVFAGLVLMSNTLVNQFMVPEKKAALNDFELILNRSLIEDIPPVDKQTAVIEEPVIEAPKEVTVEPVYTYESSSYDVVIPYSTKIEYDSSMARDTSYVKTEGSNGNKVEYYKKTYKDGIEISNDLNDTIITLQPVNRVVVEGTKISCSLEQTSDLESQLMNEINYSRCEAGTSPLTWSSSLYGLAQIRSKEITQVFDHQRPDGSAWNSVNPNLVFGENLASGGYDAGRTHQAFQDSPGHKANNMNGRFRTIGVSISYDHSGNIYWAVLFGI